MGNPYRETELQMTKIRKVIPTWVAVVLTFLGFGIGWGSGYSKTPTLASPDRACKDEVFEQMRPMQGCNPQMEAVTCPSVEHIMRVEQVTDMRFRVYCMCKGSVSPLASSAIPDAPAVPLDPTHRDAAPAKSAP